jgi:hypothetical protein
MVPPHHANGGLPSSFVPVSPGGGAASGSRLFGPSPSSSCRGGGGGGGSNNTGYHPQHFGGGCSANFVYGSPSPPAAAAAGAAGPSSKKYKTEMCKNILECGYCKFGMNCHYAHSERERNPPCAKELRKDDQLLLPCSIMVSTGFW